MKRFRPSSSFFLTLLLSVLSAAPQQAEAVRIKDISSLSAARPNQLIGYGLVVGTRSGTRQWEHGGAINGFDAKVTMWPDRRTAVVVLDNRSGGPMPEVEGFVRERVLGLPQPKPAPAIAARAGTADERARVSGSYAQGTTRVTIAAGTDTLRFTQGPATLSALFVGDDRLRILVPMGEPVELLLVRDASGQVQYLHQGLRALARQP